MYAYMCVYRDHILFYSQAYCYLFVTSLLSIVIKPFKMLLHLPGQHKNQSKTYSARMIEEHLGTK